MSDLSHLSDKIFWQAPLSADLYLRGKIPRVDSSFGIGFNGKFFVVPFEVYDFATRDITHPRRLERKEALDEWVKAGGIDKVDRFLFDRDLTASLKNGDVIELFTEFRDNVDWIENSFYIPAGDIREYSVFSY